MVDMVDRFANGADRQLGTERGQGRNNRTDRYGVME